MAGYVRLYVLGGSGGFAGADGVNPIEMLILVGAADRMWFEPRYLDPALSPLGELTTVVPAGPEDPDALLDACLAFYPRAFTACPSLAAVRAALADTTRLEFDRGDGIPAGWASLREEARALFSAVSLWQADLVPVPTAST